MKTYHIYPLLLVLILLLTGCGVSSKTERGVIKSERTAVQEEMRLGRAIHDRALQRLKEMHPEAYALYEQARMAELQGELDTAIETYHKAMQQVPEDRLLLTDLGMAYLRREDIVPARRYLLKAVDFDPDYYKSRLGLGYIYLQNRQWQKAVDHLETSLQLLSTLEGTFLLGEAEEGRGNLSRARQLYQTVVAVDKNSKLGRAANNRLRSLSK